VWQDDTDCDALEHALTERLPLEVRVPDTESVGTGGEAVRDWDPLGLWDGVELLRAVAEGGRVCEPDTDTVEVRDAAGEDVAEVHPVVLPKPLRVAEEHCEAEGLANEDEDADDEGVTRGLAHGEGDCVGERKVLAVVPLLPEPPHPALALPERLALGQALAEEHCDAASEVEGEALMLLLRQRVALLECVRVPACAEGVPTTARVPLGEPLCAGDRDCERVVAGVTEELGDAAALALPPWETLAVCV
jgi:hypothetical protein